MPTIEELAVRFTSDTSGFTRGATTVSSKLEQIEGLANSCAAAMTTLGAAVGTVAEAFGTASVGAAAFRQELASINRTAGSRSLTTFTNHIQTAGASSNAMSAQVALLTERVRILNANLEATRGLTRSAGSFGGDGGVRSTRPAQVPVPVVRGARAMGDTQALSQFASSAQAVGRALTMYVTVPIAAAEIASVHFASQFEASMVKIQGLAGVPAAMVASWEPQIRKLSEEIGRAPNELAEGMFYIASEGYRGAQAIQALTVAAKMAEIGMGRTATNAKAIVFTMHDFGVSAREAADMLVATEREGNVEVGSLATNLYKVLLPASQLHVKLRDLGASIAALTRSGMTAPQATTALSQFFSFLQKPSKQATDELKKLHMNIQQLRESAAKDLIGTFLKLYDVTKKDDGLTKLLGNIRAFRAELGELAGKRSEILKFWADFRKSHDDLDKATAERNKTIEHQFHQTMAALENAGISFGRALRPVAETVAGAVKSIADAFESLSPEMQQAIGVTGAFVAVLGPALILMGTFARAILGVRAAYALMTGQTTVARAAQMAEAGAATASATANNVQAASVERMTLSEFAATLQTNALAASLGREEAVALAGGRANAVFNASLSGMSGFAYGAVSAVGALIARIGQLIVVAARAVGVLGVLGMAERTSAQGSAGGFIDMPGGRFANEIKDLADAKGTDAAFGRYAAHIAEKRKSFEALARGLDKGASPYDMRIFNKYGDRAMDTPEAHKEIQAYVDDKMRAYKKQLFAVGKDPAHPEAPSWIDAFDTQYSMEHMLHSALNKKYDPGTGGGGGGGGKKGRKPKESEAEKEHDQMLESLNSKLHEYAKAQKQAGDESEYAALKAEILTGEYNRLVPQAFLLAKAAHKSDEALLKLTGSTLQGALAAAKIHDQWKQNQELQKAVTDSSLEMMKAMHLDPKDQAALEQFKKLYSDISDKAHKAAVDALVANNQMAEFAKAGQAAFDRDHERLDIRGSYDHWKKMVDERDQPLKDLLKDLDELRSQAASAAMEVDRAWGTMEQHRKRLVGAQAGQSYKPQDDFKKFMETFPGAQEFLGAAQGVYGWLAAFQKLVQFYKDNKGIIDGSEYLKNYSERMKDAQEETRRLMDSMKPLTDAQRIDRTAFKWIVNTDGQIEKIRVMTDEQAKQVVLQDKYNERLARTIEMVKSYAAVLSDAVGKMGEEALSHGLKGVLRVGLRSVSDSIHQMVIDSMKKSVTGAGTGMLAKLFHVKTAATPLDANTQALKDLTDVLNGKSGGSKGGIFDLPRYPWDERIPNPALGSGGGGGGFWGIIGTLLGGAGGGKGGGGGGPAQNYVFGSHGLGGGGHAPSAPGGGHTINEGAVHVHVHLPSGSRVDDVQLGLIRSHVQKGVEDARKSNRLVKRYGN